jgi:hypothetical protein
MRWDLAADALESLTHIGVVEKALGLGWDARELIGVCRAVPHDSPSRAGLIFSMRPGDSVTDVRRAGAIIAYGTVRHIWKRVPLPANGSIVLPWQLWGSAMSSHLNGGSSMMPDATDSVAALEEQLDG